MSEPIVISTGNERPKRGFNTVVIFWSCLISWMIVLVIIIVLGLGLPYARGDGTDNNIIISNVPTMTTSIPTTYSPTTGSLTTTTPSSGPSITQTTTSTPSRSPTTTFTPSSGPSITPTTSKPSLSPTTSKPSSSPTYTPTFQSWNSVSQTIVTESGAVGGTPEFGTSVTISSDGNTLASSGLSDNDFVGATWVFVHNGSSWEQQGNKLVGTGYVGQPQQGSAVSLSSNGNTLAVGGQNDNNFIGATWVFVRNGTTWTQQGNKLVGTGYAGQPDQGTSVSLSGDGLTLAVGGPSDNNGVGAVWIFNYVNGSWVQNGAKLVANINDYNQGIYVSLSSNGTTMAMAADLFIVIYVYTNGAWNEQYSNEIGNTNYSPLITLSAEGNQLGSTVDKTLYIFSRIGTTWTNVTIVTQSTVSTTMMDPSGSTIALGTCSPEATIYFYQQNNLGQWVSTGKVVPNINYDCGSDISLAISEQTPYTVAMGTPDYNSNAGLTMIITQP